MDKARIIERYKKEEDKLLVSKLLDKITLVEKQNKIQNTDFLSPTELHLAEDVLKMIKYKNYRVYGATENAQRKIITIFPSKLEDIFLEDKFDYNSICNCIRITENNETYPHSVYLGGLMKLGLKREKIGDIIVNGNSADIIVSKEITKFLMSNITQLTRFKKCKVEIINLKDVFVKEQEYEEIKIIISSLRLDNVISGLARTSRNKALDMIKQERIFINYENELKATKLVKCNDIITIRGVGKFIIDNVSGSTRNDRVVLLGRKFV